MAVLVILALAVFVGLLFWLRHAATLRSTWRAHHKGYYTYTVYK